MVTTQVDPSSGASSVTDLNQRQRPSLSEDGDGDENHDESLRSSFLEDQDKGSSQNGLKKTALARWWQRVCVRTRLLYYNTWLSEIVAMMFSIACIVALGIILLVYEGQATPHMRFGLTLNAIVSILATGARATLIFVVASAIGQLKWYRFSSSRKLSHLQDVDDASRGVLGSLTILFTFKAGFLVSLGACITVLALAYDPFVQQIIKYPGRAISIPSNATTTANASSFIIDPLSTRFLSTVNAGIWADATQFDRTLPCPSGNCTWPTFQSVGWCSKCEDVTSQAVINDECHSAVTGRLNSTCELSLNQGNSVTVYEPGRRNATNDFRGTTDVAWALRETMPNYTTTPPANYMDITNPLLVFGRANLDFPYLHDNRSLGVPKVNFVEQCAVTPCLRTYDVSVSGGEPRIKVAAVDYGVIQPRIYRNCWSLNPKTPCDHVNVSCWQLGEGNTGTLNSNQLCVYPRCEPFTLNHAGPAFCLVELYSETLIKRLTGRAELGLGCDTAETGLVGGCFSLTIQQLSVPDYMQNIEANNLSVVVGNVAASLTKLGLDLSDQAISGNLTKNEVYVAVDWEWLILPALLEMAGICVILFTIFWSRRGDVRLWKSSALALLYHGLEDPDGHWRNRSLEDVWSMNQVAEKTYVRLGKPEDADRAVLLAALDV